ncbi:MAG: hypothetical protein EZS28_041062, partial [Streblomastix strix]
MEESKLLESEGFQVIKQIGCGSFGRVFQVQHQAVGVVAAKVIRNEDFDEKEWEIAVMIQSDPPNIRPFKIQYIAAKNFETYTVMLMEYCNTGNLIDIIRTMKDLPIFIIRVIMIQILEGLKYIHSKGIVHRDIKGGNILLHNPSGSGRIILKITGFLEVKIMNKIDNAAFMLQRCQIFGLLEFLFIKLQLTHFRSILIVIKILDTNRVLTRPQLITDDLLWDLLVRMLAFDRKNRI